MEFFEIIRRKRQREKEKQHTQEVEFVKAKDEISRTIDDNLKYIKELLVDNDDIVYREFYCMNVKCATVFVDGLVSREIIDRDVIKHLMIETSLMDEDISQINAYEKILNHILATADIKEVTSFKSAILDLLCGETLLFVDGSNKIIRVSTRNFPNRGIQQPITENAVRGPRDSFNEVVRFSTAVIRRRVRDTRLRLKNMKLGRRSQTDIYLVYIDDIVDKNILNELKQRLSKIDIDAIIDGGMIEQLIEDDVFCFFPTIQHTERVDTAVAAIYEGRIVILCDNTNTALIVPATIMTSIQHAEDYYERWHIATVIRILRVIAAITAMTLQGFYISISSFTPSMIPPDLGLFIAATREGVPIPVFIEALFLEFMLELLREAGLRLPGPIGQTIGIVGGLIIGQAAVQAGIISPIMVILVATTAIASFAVPAYNLSISLRLLKFVYILVCAALGLYGFILLSLIILGNLVKLKSFGVPILSPFVSFEIMDYKDAIVRLPTRYLWARPIFASTQQKIRMMYEKSQPPSAAGENR
ncbi:spore germination protein [Caldicellulosiruptor changbaiensis]|uniref:GerA spore germination protein n=2 Tax=Caldicellulosiruptor TaxID=44000 RepID=A4XI75_CALS8|nr:MULTISPECIES: spore germination protein [Caldicellulosiruptor]ABP66610.1 GerA spore germination protein [Caldicellulosiruptor saccharolyticus DSM 8903]AZT90931.1 spore germination protein [Caldicellulosiruptor changbaiensis]